MPTDNEVVPIEEAKRAFAAAINGELASLEGSLRGLFARFDLVAKHGKGVNGLAAAAKGWRRETELLADKIRDEAADVTKALLGEGEAISEATNPELAQAVKAARGEAA